MNELKTLEPKLHIEITNFILQNTTNENITFLGNVIELKIDTYLLKVLVYFDINKQDVRSGYSISFKKIAVNFIGLVFENFVDLSHSYKPHKIIEFVEKILNN